MQWNMGSSSSRKHGTPILYFQLNELKHLKVILYSTKGAQTFSFYFAIKNNTEPIVSIQDAINALDIAQKIAQQIK